MTLANEADKLGRFIHEIVHEIADDPEVIEAYPLFIQNDEDKEELRDLVAIVINKWEMYKEEYHYHITNE